MKRRLFSLATTIVFCLPMTGTAFGLTAQDQQSLDGDSIYYQAGATAACTSSGSSSSGSTNNVYIIGDSITVRTEDAYQKAFQQAGASTVNIDGSSSRSWDNPGTDGNKLNGFGALAADKSEIQSASAVVIALGTNGDDSTANIDKAIAALRSDNSNAPIYWVDTFGLPNQPNSTFGDKNSGMASANTAIYDQASGQNYQVISWAKTVDPGVDPQDPDGNQTDSSNYIDTSDGLGVHPTPAGSTALANLVEGAVTGNGAPTGGASTTVAGSNLDYAGRPILDQGELQAISQNMSVYQQAADQAGIPWQVLAAVHYRETDLSTNANTGGPNGLYQIVGKNYPYSGQLTQQEFLQESIDAANFIKSDGANLGANSDPDTVGNAFALYNGDPPLYMQQATALGYNAQTQSYEGSPYVMNKADAKRDPDKAAAGTWLQYLTSSTTGPATEAYGAYIVYTDLAGTTLPSTGGGCSTGAVNCTSSSPAVAGLSQARQNIVCIAEQQLAAWQNGTMKPGYRANSSDSFSKYSYNNDEEWCADFASWVYAQAGYAFGPAGSRGTSTSTDVPYVGNFLVPPQDGNKFVDHPAAGYTPKPGDLAIHYQAGLTPPYYHVNIVVSVSPGSIELVGGDQLAGAGNPDTNVVSTETISAPTDDNITNYVGPD